MPVDLSVGLIVGEIRERAVRCLRSLLSQRVADRMEILVYDIGRDAHPPLPDSNHPQVRVVRAPELTFTQARVRIVHDARAPVVGFLEEHAWAYDGWAEAIIEAHGEQKRGGVGAEVHIGNPTVRQSVLIGIMNHNEWLAPTPAGVRGHLPGHNSAYKRDVLLRYGDRLPDLLRAELALCRRLIADGYQLYLEPRARFAHINETEIFGISRGYFLWNRCYGDARAREFHWSPLRKAFYAACTPLMPVYYLAHFLPRLRRTRPDLYRTALAGLPKVFLAQLASGIGHTAGVLFGRGNAERDFSHYELNMERELGANAA